MLVLVCVCVCVCVCACVHVFMCASVLYFHMCALLHSCPLLVFVWVQLTRVVLNRMTQEKEQMAKMERLFAKMTHANPLPIVDKVLVQAENYDSFVEPVVEICKKMSPMSLDCVAFVLLHRLSSDRERLVSMNLAPWLQNLGRFVGCFYRKYPKVELEALLRFILLRLEGNGVGVAETLCPSVTLCPVLCNDDGAIHV